MIAIQFEDLPKAVSQLCEDIAFIKNHLITKGEESKPDQDDLLTVQAAAEFLSLSVPTIYGLISKGDLPVMKRSKRCYFSKRDLLNYLKEGRRRSNSEIAVQAEYLTNRKAR